MAKEIMSRPIGFKHSEETKKKMSTSRMGDKNPNFGKHLSEETISRIRIGKKIREETLGYTNSPETRKKMSISNKGLKRSEETKRRISESHKGLNTWSKGKNSHLWKGGISFNPYSVDWTNSLRISIRERDKYTCQMCGEKQGDNVFSVHHIDYNKTNCNPNNLITLCRNCHSKTNFNREKWIVYFSNK